MAIEVLLRRSVETLGKVGEVVRVRPGYARNYLLPWGIAVLPSTENLRLVEKDKVAEAAREEERAKERAETAARLGALSLRIDAKANPEGHLFGSVGPRQLVEALAAKGFDLEERHVHLEPVKTVGEHEAKIRLGGDVEVPFKFQVGEESAIAAAAAAAAANAAAAATPAPAPAASPTPAPAKAPKAAKPAK
jgi:large subunit ribosomal protein L9